ncbi:alpha/beta fold hydrolase [Gryllotalpicola reticulitermitis]|uniref:Alpha/beta fold hydrolase n=1 Tax=Gryllotalpicola reticulitermitis TaxID=1184153 RepID=A0ABV8Q2U5_9MICO
MDVIMLPGYWLRGTSWDEVEPIIATAGHVPHPLTLPGLDPDAKVADTSLQTQIDAVVAAIDGFAKPVVLVAHSGASVAANGAVDARPDKVSRVVYVDTLPMPERGVSESEYPADGDAVPLPDFGLFDERELKDLTPEQFERFRSLAAPEPLGVVTAPIELHDARRHEVPITMICTSMPSSVAKGFIEQHHPWVSELEQFREISWVDIDTGHWPQFTRPRELGDAIVAALA